MNINSIDKTNEVMTLLTKRQEALATNLANMDTPNYVRRDVDFKGYLSNTNSPLEIELTKKLGPSNIMETSGEKRKPEDELAEMQKTSILYALATKKMTSTITQMKTAMNVGSQ